MRIADMPHTWNHPNVVPAKFGLIGMLVGICVADHSNIEKGKLASLELREILGRNNYLVRGDKIGCVGSNVLSSSRVLNFFSSKRVLHFQLGKSIRHELAELGGPLRPWQRFIGKQININNVSDSRGFPDVLKSNVSLYACIWNWPPPDKQWRLGYHVRSLVNLKNLLLVYEGIVGRFSGTFGSSRGNDGLAGGSLRFLPLESSVVSVQANDDQCQEANYYGQPVSLGINKKWKPFVAAGFFVAGVELFVIALWLIKSGCDVEYISVIDIAKIALGILLILLGWVTEHASLDLIDLCCIYWGHLL
jgi:hypothetical protein